MLPASSNALLAQRANEIDFNELRNFILSLPPELAKWRPKFLHARTVAEITGLNERTLERHRYEGTGIPFIRCNDGSKGRVRYIEDLVYFYMFERIRTCTSDDLDEGDRVRERIIARLAHGKVAGAEDNIRKRGS